MPNTHILDFTEVVGSSLFIGLCTRPDVEQFVQNFAVAVETCGENARCTIANIRIGFVELNRVELD